MLTRRNAQDQSAPNFAVVEAEFRRVSAADTIKVLLVANDLMADGAVASDLEGTDCGVTRVESATEAVERVTAERFDVIVVDLRPDIIGYQTVCQLRIANIDLPVLFISARSSADALNRAYSVGADDVAVLPLAPRELETRIVRLSGRSNACSRSQMHVGRLEIDLTTRNAQVDGRPLPLYSDEYAAFEVLVSRNGAPVAKDAILAYAYDDRAVSTDGNADTLIHRLRRKLDKAGAGDVIQTMGRLGYALSNVDLFRLEQQPMPVSRAA